MYLKEIAGKVIGSFRVGTGYFVQGTLLTHSVEGVDFAYVVSTPRPYDQEIRRWKSVLVDGRPYVLFSTAWIDWPGCNVPRKGDVCA